MGSRLDLGSLRPRLAAATMVAPEERSLAGVVSGVLYAVGGLTLAPSAVLPGVTHAHWIALLAIAAVAVVWGLISGLVIHWLLAPPWLIHVSNTAAFGVIGAAVASSGGARSPAWIYLFFVAVFAAYFYRPAVAVAYLAGCLATQSV